MEFMLFASNKANPNKVIIQFFFAQLIVINRVGLGGLAGGVCDGVGDVDGGDGSVGDGGGGDGDVGHLPKHEDLWMPRPHLPACMCSCHGLPG